MPQLPISDLNDPRLFPYRDLTQRNLIRQSGLFIAEGEKVVARLIASDFPVHSLVAVPEFADRYAAKLPAETPIYVVSPEFLQEVAGFQFHRGVLACGRRRPWPSLVELVGNEPRQTWVVCPNVQDPTNLGAILRSCRGFGVSGVILGNESADPFSRRVLRVSMGAVFQLPIIETHHLAEPLRELQTELGFELVATVLDAAAEPLTNFVRASRTALFFGSEGHGLGENWINACPRKVTLPMSGGCDSLNVAVAAGVFLYHFCRVS